MTSKHQMKGTRVGREYRNDLDTPTACNPTLVFPIATVPLMNAPIPPFYLYSLNQVFTQHTDSTTPSSQCPPDLNLFPLARPHDPLLALGANISLITALAPRDLAVGEPMVIIFIRAIEARGAGSEGEEPVDKVPEVRHVDDDDGSRGFAGVPV